MNYAALPPEVNSALMHAGAGPGPMLEAAASWAGLANELRSASASFASVTRELTGGPWQGQAAAKMAEAAAPYAAWLAAAAVHSDCASNQAAAVAAAFEASYAATVQPVVIAANRTVITTLVNTNFFGLNIPVIAALEGDYDEMWARDVNAMFAYHVDVSAALSRLAPVAQQLGPLLGSSPAMPTSLPGTSVTTAPQAPAAPAPPETPSTPAVPPLTKMPAPPPGSGRIYPPGPVKIPV